MGIELNLKGKKFSFSDVVIATSKDGIERVYFVARGATVHEFRLVALEDGCFLTNYAGTFEELNDVLNRLYKSYTVLKKDVDYSTITIS